MIDPPDPNVAAKLREHGIVVERLIAPVSVSVQQFRVTRIEGAARPDQGHHTNTIAGEYSTADKEFAAGTLYVDLAQRLGNVAAYLLEPESDDGLVVWNAFDSYLARQWSREPQVYPVFKLFDPVRLVTGPAR